MSDKKFILRISAEVQFYNSYDKKQGNYREKITDFTCCLIAEMRQGPVRVNEYFNK